MSEKEINWEPDKRWDLGASKNPYPKNMPDPERQAEKVLQVVKAARHYERKFLELNIKFRAGDFLLLDDIVKVINNYKACIGEASDKVDEMLLKK